MSKAGVIPVARKGKFSTAVYPGARFGRLVIIDRLPKMPGKSRFFYKVRCQCDCGREYVAETTQIARGIIVSCGCYRKDNLKRIARRKAAAGTITGLSVPGARFGRLTVIRRVETDGFLTDKVECICDCGNKTRSAIDSLGRGTTQSCGCLQSDLTVLRNKRIAKFGCFSREQKPTFNVWTGVISRCFRSKAAGFQQYGARGITMCAFLRNDPRNLVGIVGLRPGNEYTLDRFPDGSGHYSCGTCEQCKANGWLLNIRWATNTEQMLNRRTTVWVTAFGQTLSKSQWARASGLAPGTIDNRLKRGWSIERAVTTPDKHGHCYRP